MRYRLEFYPVASEGLRRSMEHNAWHDNLECQLSMYFRPRALLLLRLWLDDDFYTHDQNIPLDKIEDYLEGGIGGSLI